MEDSALAHFYARTMLQAEYKSLLSRTRRLASEKQLKDASIAESVIWAASIKQGGPDIYLWKRRDEMWRFQFGVWRHMKLWNRAIRDVEKSWTPEKEDTDGNINT